MSMEQYFDSVWDWFKNKEHEEITECYVCGSHVFRLDKDIAVCANCDFVWRHRAPTGKTLTEFYDKSLSMDYWALIKNTPQENWRQSNKFEFVYKKITELKLDKVLDVGCGNGYFLNNVPCKVTRIGIEPNAEASKYCNYPVYPDYSTFVNSIHTNVKFDLITFFGVVEHLKDPLKEIEKYTKHLSEKGKIAIIVPNVKSLVVKTLWQECSTFCPQHLWYFNFETLSFMMEKIGMGYGFCTTVEPEAQPVINKINGLKPYEKGTRILYPKELEDGIINNHLGYKLVCFFSKNIL
jgi:SAM-dependent methyltransferase